MKIFLAICIVSVLFFGACDDNYFSDGGILPEQVGKFQGNTMDYLAAKPAQFDTLTRLIQLNNLEQEVNAEGNTFFVPQNYSIYNFLKLKYPDARTRPKTLEDIAPADMAEIAAAIKNYVVPNERILKSDLTTQYSYGKTLLQKNVRFNVVHEDYLGNVNMGASYIMFSLDKSTDGATASYQSAKVVVTDIETSNGVVHVLVPDTHVFGFN